MNRLTFLLLSTLASLSLAPLTVADEQSQETARLPLSELRHFTHVFDQIRQAYVEEVDDETLLEHAIAGLLSGLDPHSVYLDHSSYDDLQEHSTGKFGGLGIEVGMEDGFVRVISPIDDTPAQRAGILAGDLIIKLDDQAIQGMGLQQAIDHMRGEPGTAILLTVVRDNTDGPIEIEIIRDIIKVRSVRSETLEPGYGYIRIAQFQENTGAQFQKSLKKLLTDEKPLKGLVLDLRNNPGGLLQASIEVVDALLEDGLVVYTEGRLPGANNKYSAGPGDTLNGLPVVVLINGGSASAAEIVAGALQDHHRAVVMGTDSFGKGSVQSVMPLGDGRAIKLTTARYFTPAGRSIQASGINPDILVRPAEIHLLETRDYIKESNLSGHLSNGKTSDSADKKKQFEASSDNQLYEALNLLKGVNILSSSNLELPANEN